jgi:hypothetical protein
MLRWVGRTRRKANNPYVSAERTAQRRIFTPLDGTITVVLNSAPMGSSISLERQLGVGLRARRSITTAVCGDSSLLLKVSTVVPRGRFRVTVSLP